MIRDTAMTIPSTDRSPDVTKHASDAVLLRAQAGDKVAFEELMRRHERLVFGTARRILAATEDAEDAAQEVFLRLFHHLGRLDPKRPLGAWLYRVTVNVCRTFGRRRRSRPTEPLGDDVEGLLDARARPDAATKLAEARRMVAAGLGTLAAKERVALTLHDLEELSTREVAEALGVTEVTVRTHLCRGRLKMRAFRERWQKGNLP